MPCSKQILTSTGRMLAGRGKTAGKCQHLCVFDPDSVDLCFQDLANNDLFVGKDLVGNQANHLVHPVWQGVGILPCCILHSQACNIKCTCNLLPRPACWILGEGLEGLSGQGTHDKMHVLGRPEGQGRPC